MLEEIRARDEAAVEAGEHSVHTASSSPTGAAKNAFSAQSESR